MRDVNALKRIYSISGVLGTDRKLIVCPMPAHMHHRNTPSFSIFHDREGFERFKCHGNCGLEGDVVDLVGYLEVAGYDPKDNKSFLQAVARLQGKEMEVYIPATGRERATLALSPNAWREHYPAREAGIRYLKSRGLTEETIETYKLGQKGSNYVSFPAFEQGILVNLKYRRIAGSGLRYFEEKGSRKSLYGYDDIAYKGDPIIITKGHIPTLLLLQRGILSTNITAGENAHLSEWWPQMALASHRVYVGDNDTDPTVREKMQAFARQRALDIRAEVKFPPEEYKDLDDWILGDPGALEIIKSWIK